MPVDGKLTERDYRLVSFVEEYFWRQRKAPQLSEIKEFLKWTEAEIIALLEDSVVKQYLESRHITNPLEPGAEATGLTPLQLYAANVLLNPDDPRSFREKLKELKVSSHQFEVWCNDPRFAGYLQRRADNLLGVSKWRVDQSLFQNATNGDTRAQELYYKLTGHLKTQHEVSFNLDGLLSQVVEIVSNYVTSEQMKDIAADIEILLQTGQAPLRLPTGNIIELEPVRGH